MATYPNPNWNYPECLAEYSIDAKKKKAEEIYANINSIYAKFYSDILERCECDFKLASLVGYKIATEFYKDTVPETPYPQGLSNVEKLILPIYYCGGNMCSGRWFSINHLAFSSPDSIIGFRDSEYTAPQEYFKILKGLKFIGTHKNWTLFKLDRNSTDDMTGMLYSPLEKNFTIEFAHFPHDAERRFIFRWVDC